MTPLHPVDVALVAAFVLYVVVTGLRSRRQASRSLEEYFLAGRDLGGWSAGLSMAATQFAADTPLLVTGLVATAGIFALWQLWSYALAFLLLGFVLAPCWRRARVLTDAELAELRYGRRAAGVLRVVKALYFGTVVNCVVLAWVLFATRAIAEPFLVWDQWLPAGLFAPVESLVRAVGVPLASDPAALDVWTASANNLISLAAIVGVTLFYSTTGGLRSVVSTDVVQFGLGMLGTAVYAGFVIHHFGGMGPLVDALHEHFGAGGPGAGGPGGIRSDQILAFTPSRARDASLAVLAVFGLQWFIQQNADGTGYLAQRTMACRSDRDARLASVVFTFAQVLLRSLVWLPIALGLLLLFPPGPEAAGAAGAALAALRHEREVTFVRGIAELLPWGIRGLLLTALLAALASTIDSHLNWGASYWTRDLYERLWCRGWRGREPDPRASVRVARTSNVLIVVLALAVMTRLDSIEQAWRMALLLGAGMGPLLVLRWLWWRISAWGELACVGVSLLAAAPLLALVDDNATRLLWMATLASVAGVAVSWLTPEADECLDTFFRRVDPPGWWGPVARRAGRDPREGRRRLARGLAGMATAAVCVFSLLTGLGAWLCRSPAPVWWPGPWGVWIAAQLATGLALAPVWWRLGFADEPPRTLSAG